MQKKIIALAIASALTVPALAHAEATVYGQANLSYDRVNDGAAVSATQNQLVSNNSFVGVKGSDDLGNGLTAIWQMEGTVGLDAGTTGTSLFNRNTFLGVKSASLGTLLAGNYDTPYKTSVRRLDMFANSVVADNRSRIFLNDARRQNSINFISNNLSGFTLALASVFGAESAASGAAKGTATSVSGTFEQGPIYVALAMDSVKKGDIGTGDLAGAAAADVGDKTKATKLGVGYTMSQFAVSAIVEKTTMTDGPSSVDTKGTNVYVGGKFNVSSTDAVKLSFGKKGATTTAGTKATNEVKQIVLGYERSLTKSTAVYALYSKVTAQDAPAPAVKTADPSTLSFGMKHAF